ncbi:FAD-dependent oxidoreductase [Pseudacidovorax sp. NFM-22]|uniref:FAD-dependent oxidoreductase n=1 Tax=Pseudacidovorax sp. NFM-22 TaxID=2744469 RepID=UPI001F284BFA|nr:FAD-dependent oxidoreductase [Pseudacidovorax sp. NFM-22]
MKPSDIPPHRFRGTGEQVQAIQFDYRRSPDQEAPSPVRHPVVIVGAGPVGLTLAIDLAQRGQPVLVVDNDDRLSTGSRALCFAKRTLEIWDRLGVGDAMVAKGVSWNLGKVFLRDQQLYQFNLLPEDGHERPAFINLQQYYCEAYLVERALQLPGLEIRWKNTLAGIAPRPDGATLTLDTPDGPYRIEADWVVACDGSRSPTRQLMGLESQGRVFRDRFLIADVRMTADFPTERWFWFDPPFHPNQSVLLHREPDNVWRIDFQLGWDADPQAERQPEKVIARVRALLGPDAEFSLEWASVYTFACQRMERFVHGRVVFAGDSAHGVSPFGARGANSGVQDADNLGWKLDHVMRGQASATLIDTYGSEREAAADENILHSSRATDFITPKSEISRLFRDQVLALARSHEFARRLVNSGRLSVPCVLRASPLNTPDAEAFDSAMVPGAPLCDAPLQTPQGDPAWLLRSLGPDFTLLVFGEAPHWVRELPGVAARCLGQELIDAQGVLARRLDAQPGTAYLVRPDQHVCARWRQPSLEAVRAALRLAIGLRD